MCHRCVRLQAEAMRRAIGTTARHEALNTCGTWRAILRRMERDELFIVAPDGEVAVYVATGEAAHTLRALAEAGGLSTLHPDENGNDTPHG